MTITYRRCWLRKPRWEATYSGGHYWTMGWGATKDEALHMLLARVATSAGDITTLCEEGTDRG